MKNTKRAKFVIIFVSTLVLCLFITGLVQTLVLKNLEKKNNEYSIMKEELKQKDKKADEQKNYYESNDYIDEYFRTHGNCNEDDIIYTK